MSGRVGKFGSTSEVRKKSGDFARKLIKSSSYSDSRIEQHLIQFEQNFSDQTEIDNGKPMKNLIAPEI